MRCFEESVGELIGLYVPTFEGEDWAAQLQHFLLPLGLRAKFIEIDERVIVSRRLPNGKVHAEVMHPTLITIVESIEL